MNLKLRCSGLTSIETKNDYDDVLVNTDGTRFTQQDFNCIQQLPDIIKNSGELGEFELGNLRIKIMNLDTYEKDLIICKK